MVDEEGLAVVGGVDDGDLVELPTVGESVVVSILGSSVASTTTVGSPVRLLPTSVGSILVVDGDRVGRLVGRDSLVGRRVGGLLLLVGGGGEESLLLSLSDGATVGNASVSLLGISSFSACRHSKKATG